LTKEQEGFSGKTRGLKQTVYLGESKRGEADTKVSQRGGSSILRGRGGKELKGKRIGRNAKYLWLICRGPRR